MPPPVTFLQGKYLERLHQQHSYKENIRNASTKHIPTINILGTPPHSTPTTSLQESNWEWYTTVRFMKPISSLQMHWTSVREDTYKKGFDFGGRTTKRGGGGKTPITTKQKTFFCMMTRTSWNKRKTNKKKFHLMFSAGQYIDQEKKFISNFAK